MLTKLEFGVWVYTVENKPFVKGIFGESSKVKNYLDRGYEDVGAYGKFSAFNFETEELFESDSLRSIYDAIRLSVRNA